MSLEVVSAQEFAALAAVVKTLKEEVEALKAMPEYPELVTPKQAAQMLKRDPKTILKMCKAGKLSFIKGLRKVEIYSQSIKEYKLKRTIKAS